MRRQVGFDAYGFCLSMSSDRYNDSPVPGLIHADSGSKGWRGIHASVINLARENRESPATPKASGLILGYRLAGVLKSRYKLGDDPWREVICKKDRFMVMPGGEEMQWRWQAMSNDKTSLDLMLVNIEQNVVDRIAAESTDSGGRSVELQSLTNKRDPVIANMVSAIKRELTNEDAFSRLYIDTVKQQMVIHMLRHYCAFQYKSEDASSGLSSAQLSLVNDYIQMYFQNDIALRDLANLLNISEYYFSRLYKNAAGISPYQYLMTVRFGKAQELLKFSDLSVKEVAYKIGYKEANQFNRAFKKRFNISPNKYRQAHR